MGQRDLFELHGGEFDGEDERLLFLTGKAASADAPVLAGSDLWILRGDPLVALGCGGGLSDTGRSGEWGRSCAGLKREAEAETLHATVYVPVHDIIVGTLVKGLTQRGGAAVSRLRPNDPCGPQSP